MQMWILKPPGFDPTKKWPRRLPRSWRAARGLGRWLEFPLEPGICGPPRVMSSPCRIRAAATGFGQKFVDEISGDWGGKCYRRPDGRRPITSKNCPTIDKDRIGAAGASLRRLHDELVRRQHRPSSRRLITHCCVWNFESMWGTTEELWFDEYEHGGLPWGKNRGSYAKFSPHKKAGQSRQVQDADAHHPQRSGFPLSRSARGTSCSRRCSGKGCQSRFINFPDEGHWVTKPKNGEYWHQEVFNWLKKYNPPGPK